MKKRNILIACGVVVLIILGLIINDKKEIEKQVDQIIESSYTSSQIIIDVKGEVKSPGIYYLNSNSRVIDAINIAGGITSSADINKINLALKLEDGMIVNIFKKDEAAGLNKISINNSSMEQLMKLPGIGEVKAKSIIDYRNKNGFFMSLEALKSVDGITENIYKQIKEFICL